MQAMVDRRDAAAPFVSCADDGLTTFLTVRPRLFGIAYRILRSAPEAEDVVQDVWLRWQATDRTAVLNAAAFLSTATTRLAINVIHSARCRRETDIEPGLPEPMDANADSGRGAERSEALEFAVLTLLEKLTPAERAAYVLREAFDYSYRRIAGILRLQEANTRQLVARARQHVAGDRRAPVSAGHQRRLIDAFIDAVQGGNIAGLEGVLTSDVVSSPDRFVRVA